jgi:hypothetical protein
MSVKKWLLLLALGVVLCVGMVVLAVVVFVMWPRGRPADLLLPVYTMEQTDSSHPGYHRTTITSGTNVYVNDYEEAALFAFGSEPTKAVGRTPMAGETFCAIPGQKPNTYLVHLSEMGPEEIYRNIHEPLFPWRTAMFQKMRFGGLLGPAMNKDSTDLALIADVHSTLRDGMPSKPPSYVSGSLTNVYVLYLLSDQLPGLAYCAGVYMDHTGPVYLAENPFSTRWIRASERFASWLQTK